MMPKELGSLCLAVLFIVALDTSGASGSVIWDEAPAANGDLSNNRLAPTALTFSLGTNSLMGRIGSPDVDYVNFHLPAGDKLSAITLAAYSGTAKSFIAVQAGTTFTEPATGTNPANLLGYDHFGPTGTPVGADLLAAMGTAAGAIDFTPPLTASDYTFWMQDTSPTALTYQMDFIVAAIPEPTTLDLGFAGLAILGLAHCGRQFRRA